MRGRFPTQVPRVFLPTMYFEIQRLRILDSASSCIVITKNNGRVGFTFPNSAGIVKKTFSVDLNENAAFLHERFSKMLVTVWTHLGF